jgi:hypothetical protein
MTKRDMPAAFYAAAGAGDLALRRLRHLPGAANRTLRAAGAGAATLRQRVATGESRLNRERITADLASLRGSAQRGANVLATRAGAVQERAVTGYRNLVAHGERVMAERTAHPEGAGPAEIGPAAGAAGQAPTVEPEQPAAAVEPSAAVEPPAAGTGSGARGGNGSARPTTAS